MTSRWYRSRSHFTPDLIGGFFTMTSLWLDPFWEATHWPNGPPLWTVLRNGGIRFEGFDRESPLPSPRYFQALVLSGHDWVSLADLERVIRWPKKPWKDPACDSWVNHTIFYGSITMLSMGESTMSMAITHDFHHDFNHAWWEYSL